MLNQFKLAIIGGTGVGALIEALTGETYAVRTPYGLIRGRAVILGGSRVLALSRHSAGHRVPPHHVPYLALAWGIRRLGISRCVASAAVGSLNPAWTPGTMLVVSDFIDASSRNLTLFENNVRHTAMDFPFGGVGALLPRAAATPLEAATYVQANGPRYESYAEIAAFRMLGGGVVGMTAASEAIAMREAGIRYECLAIVTNLGAGLSPDIIDHGAVGDVMTEAGSQVLELFSRAAALAASAEPGAQ